MTGQLNIAPVAPAPPPGGVPKHPAAEAGMALLRMGKYREGFRAWDRFLEYEARRLSRACEPFGRPRWDGSPLDGRSLRILPMFDGLGDEVQLVRFIPAVLDLAGPASDVTWLADPALVRLFRGNFDEHITVAPLTPQALLAPCDVWISPMGLPHLLGTTPASIPPAPYLRADERLVTQWRRTIEDAGPGLRVGLNWAGSPYTHVERRAMKLAEFAPLAEVPGLKLFGLQKTTDHPAGFAKPADGGAESEPAPPGLGLVRLGPLFADLANAAAAIAQLDLVISTDTAIAHLSAALGIATWVLVARRPTFWLWTQERDRCPWYGSMRVFQQQRAGDWSAPVERVADELRRMVAERGAA